MPDLVDDVVAEDDAARGACQRDDPVIHDHRQAVRVGEKSVSDHVLPDLAADLLICPAEDAHFAYPYVPIGNAVRISVAILSYVDTVSFGVTADYDSSPDLDTFVEGIRHSLTELSGPAAS